MNKPMVIIDYNEYQKLIADKMDLLDFINFIYRKTIDNKIQHKIKDYMESKRYWL